MKHVLSDLVGFRSFRAQIALLYGGLIIALSIALAAALGSMLSAQIRTDKGLALQLVSRNAAHMLAAGMRDRNLIVKSLSLSDFFEHGFDDKTLRRRLELVQASGQHRAWIGVADISGIVRSATGGLLVGQSVAEIPWFQAGLAGSNVGDVHTAKLLSSLLPAKPDGTDLRFVDFSAPIAIQGRVAGVITMHVDWDWVRSVVHLIVPPDAASEQLELFIFDHAGKVIFSPRGAHDTLAAQAYQPGVPSSTPELVEWLDGVTYLTSISTMPVLDSVTDLGWTLVARVPAAVAFAPARQALWYALTVGALASAIGAAVAWFASGTLSKSLSAIAKAARDVARRVPGATIPHRVSSTEVSQLSSALSDMTEQLLANNAELESRVADRTAALEQANARLETLNVELESLAMHDPLTGLLNRRAFEIRMDQALASAKRTGKPISVLMVDADHFKLVNDRFGHETGDDVLKMLAVTLGLRLRETDVVARMGGEEFAILLPDTDQRGALMVAEQVCIRISEEAMPPVGQVTVSVGVATSFASADARLTLMRTADKALYEAKSAGRNRAFQFGDIRRVA